MNEKLLIPFSILIGAAIVGLAIYFATSSDEKKVVVKEEKDKVVKETTIKKVGEGDYILGNENAEAFVIEYSDLECPFCKTYNDESSKKLQDKYLEDGKVAFVFRNFPLTIHPSAFGEAIATECAGVVGGSKKFYEYKNKIFAETSSNGKFNVKRLPEIATSIGLEKKAFEACLKNEATTKKIRDDYKSGVDAGVRGTPTVFIQLKSGETFPAVADFKVVDEALENYFNQKEETEKVTK
ncbi:hypothetical protein CSB11_00475 [Candidatus Campbellbacteria bacterium]|nr:MAG: hypothetical protein CSB11_00475 [Candidatus Campbellbacteria bacterium]